MVIRASNGEAVTRAAVVSEQGAPAFEALNAGRADIVPRGAFAAGGFPTGVPAAAVGPSAGAAGLANRILDMTREIHQLRQLVGKPGGLPTRLVNAGDVAHAAKIIAIGAIDANQTHTALLEGPAG